MPWAFERIRALDLRFHSKESESRFRRSLEPRLVFAGTAVHFVFFVFYLLVVTLNPEDEHIDLDVDDARSHWAMSRLILGTCVGVMALLSFLRLRCQCCKRWNWEVLFTSSFAFLVACLPWITGWTAAKLYDVDPSQIWVRDMRSAEGGILLIFDTVITTLCLLVPIRMVFKWIPSVIGVLSFVFSRMVVGSPFPGQLVNNIMILVFLNVLALAGAWYNEQVARQNFVAQQLVREASIEIDSLVDEKNAFEMLLSMVSDAVLWLAADGNTILKCDARFNTIVGASMQGKSLSLCFANDEEDRLHAALERAGNAPTLLPTSLVAPATLDSHINIDCFIVPHRTIFGEQASVSAQNEASRPAFLLGVRTNGEIPKVPASADDTLNIFQIAFEQKDKLEQSSLRNSKDGTCETTSTGKLFKDIAARGRGKRGTAFVRDDDEGDQDSDEGSLKDLVKLGKRQGWLLNGEDVNLKQGDFLGRGSFGMVMGGFMHGTEVAVKLPAASQQRSHLARNVSSFANELCILRHVRHPNIVLFFGALVDEQTDAISLVLEQVKGKDLYHYIAELTRGSLVGIRWQLIMDVACALRYLHAQRPQILHGDLKATNVLVECRQPKAKLADFGLARVLTRHVEPMGGSLPWMAPEIILKELAKPCASADVFSFGCIVHMVLSGLKPLDGLGREAILQIAKARQSRPWIWPEDMPWKELCSELCRKTSCLEQDQRPSMQAIHREISTWNIHKTLAESLEEADGDGSPGLLERGDCQARDARSLVVPNFQPTQIQAKMLAIFLQGKHWNFYIDAGCCCPWHAMLADMKLTIQAMWQQSCRENWIPYSNFQCRNCGTLHSQQKCDLCGTSHSGSSYSGSSSLKTIKEELNHPALIAL